MPPGRPAGDTQKEIDDEIEFYLEERAAEFRAEGMSAEEARHAAIERFGDVSQISSEVRAIQRRRARERVRTEVMSSLFRDVRIALRGFRLKPGFTGLVVGTLALGIGAVTAIFSVVNASLLTSPPFNSPEDLVFVQGAYDAPEGPAIRGASVPEFRDWASESKAFDALTPFWSISVNLTGDGAAQRVQAEHVGEAYFGILGVEADIGRTFSAREAALPGGENVALLGNDLWRGRYGGTPEIVGQTVYLNGAAFTVIGVLPEGFSGMNFNADLWLPIGNPTTGIDAELAEARGSRWLSVVGRLSGGRSIESAQVEFDGIAERLQVAYPDAHEDRIAVLTGIKEFYLGTTGPLMLLVLGATGLILIIAGANVAGLLLVRSTGRTSEVLLRKALGAGRGRLVRQFLTESIVLSLMGATGGLIVGVWGAKALGDLTPENLLPAYVEMTPDLKVFGLAAALMLAVGIAAGIGPALASTSRDLAGGLRERSDRGGARTHRAQPMLVVGQIALALMLLVGAGLMARSFQSQLNLDPGFDHESLYVFRTSFPPEPYSGDALRAAAQQIVQDFQATPEISSVAFGGGAPLRGGFSAAYLYLDGGGAEDRIRFYLQRVSPDWFTTLGTPILQGRALNAADLDNPEVTVISRALADRFFPGEDPVGATIRVGGPDGLPLRIVGVAANARFRDLTTDLLAGADDPDIYLPWDRFATRTVDVVLRTSLPASRLEPLAREVVQGFDPDLPVFMAQPMTEPLRAQTSQARFGAVLLITFSVIAAALALVGLYGLLSFAVSQRRREIAIRMAVGAEAPEVRRMVVRQGMTLVFVGLAMGLVGALLASQSLEVFLHGVERLDMATYGVTFGLMAVVALLAAWVPATRATRVDPQQVLGEE